MNWNPLKRTSLNQRPELNPARQNANEALERLVTEFDSAENTTKALCQSAKKLIDQILCMGKFETKLTDDLAGSNLFNDDEHMRTIIEEWHSFAFTANTIGDEYVISLQKTIIEPLKQLKKTFGELRTAIRIHDSLQLNVIKYQRKAACYDEKEKTGTNLVKQQEIRSALTASQREFERQTQTLVNDLMKFLTGSVEMLQPLLEGFIAAEVAWVRACKRTLDERSHLPGVDEMLQPAQQDRMKSIEDSFRAMSSLSICLDGK